MKINYSHTGTKYFDILEDPELMSKIVHNIQEEPHD